MGTDIEIEFDLENEELDTLFDPLPTAKGQQTEREKQIQPKFPGSKPKAGRDQELLKCDQCKKPFKTKKTQQQHISNVHNTTTEKNRKDVVEIEENAISYRGISLTRVDENYFKCSKCGKVLKRKAVRRHIKEVHKLGDASDMKCCPYARCHFTDEIHQKITFGHTTMRRTVNKRLNGGTKFLLSLKRGSNVKSVFLDLDVMLSYHYT